MSGQQAARRHLSVAIADLWPGSVPRAGPGEDLSAGERLEHYRTPDAMGRYVHMHAAKHIGLWRRVRQSFETDHRPVFSIGGGPLLCLMGWCFDNPWPGDLTAVEPMDWSPVTSNPNWATARQMLCGDVDELTAYVPGPTVPGQLRPLGVQRALLPGELPDEAIVLLPYVVNHLMDDRHLSANAANEMAAWVSRAVLARRATVVIADMPPTKLDLWTPLLTAMGCAMSVPSLEYPDDCAELKDLYGHPTDQSFRCGIDYPHMCKTPVLVVNSSTKVFLT